MLVINTSLLIGNVLFSTYITVKPNVNERYINLASLRSAFKTPAIFNNITFIMLTVRTGNNAIPTLKVVIIVIYLYKYEYKSKGLG